MSNKKTLTVVYEINDNDAFKAHFNEIHAKFLLDNTAPWRSYCMSVEDEPHRVKLIHEASQHEDYRCCDLADLIEEIYHDQDIRRYEDLESFLKRTHPKDE